AVRVVLDVCDLRGHAILVRTTEVDDSVGALVATTDVAGRDPTAGVAATGLGERTHERLLRGGASHLDEVCDRAAATTRCGRLVLTDTHGSLIPSLQASDARAPEDVDRTLAQGDDGALGVLALAEPEAGPAGLAPAVHGVDGVDLDLEDLLDRDLDLGLVGAGVDDEGVLALVEQPVGLLRDDRSDEGVAGVLECVESAHLVSCSSLPRPPMKAS